MPWLGYRSSSSLSAAAHDCPASSSQLVAPGIGPRSGSRPYCWRGGGIRLCCAGPAEQVWRHWTQAGEEAGGKRDGCQPLCRAKSARAWACAACGAWGRRRRCGAPVSSRRRSGRRVARAALSPPTHPPAAEAHLYQLCMCLVHVPANMACCKRLLQYLQVVHERD